MSTVLDLHQDAMEYAVEADTLRRLGFIDKSIVAFRRASRLEGDAAMLLLDNPNAEPTRSILFRSAGSLAMDAGEPDEAAAFASHGLDGDPPAEIKAELEDLLQRATTIKENP